METGEKHRELYKEINDNISSEGYGKAIFNMESSKIITNYMGDTLDKYNVFQGTSDEILNDKKIVDAIAVFL